MARTISKAISSATIYALDASKPFDIDNGKPVANMVFNMDGNPSENKARIEASRIAGHKNVMILNIKIDESKVSVSPDVFLVNSAVCVDGESYGREYITQTFKITFYRGWYTDENGNMIAFENAFMGVTTDSKLRNHAIEACGTQNVIITEKTIKEERRFMRREKYMSLAK